MPTTKPGISVVLPNYNGRQLLEENLPSLFSALGNYDGDYEVIVADDASTDDSIDFLEKNYPDIRLTLADSNHGFSWNCNNGAKAATKDLLCISNTDAVFDIDYFRNVSSIFQNNVNLFALKGDIHNYGEDRENPFNIGKTCQLYAKRGLLRFNHNVTPEPSNFGPHLGQQFLPLGTAFVCDRKKYIEIGGYDEIFSPYYWEDSDIALRALRKGWEIHYAPESKIYHKTSSTISRTQSNIRRRLVSIRNKHLFAWHHMEGIGQWSIHLIFIATSLMTRWLILDWKYYIALIWAIWRQLTFRSNTCQS